MEDCSNSWWKALPDWPDKEVEKPFIKAEQVGKTLRIRLPEDFTMQSKSDLVARERQLDVLAGNTPFNWGEAPNAYVINILTAEMAALRAELMAEKTKGMSATMDLIQADREMVKLRQQVIDRDLLAEECKGLRKEITALRAAAPQASPAPTLGDQVAAFADAWASRGWPR